MAGDFPWPREAIDMLRRYWENGASASYIAGQINAEFKCAFSRNAVMGKINRLGLQRGPQEVRHSQRRSADRTNAIARSQKAIVPPKPGVERKAPVIHNKLAPRIKVEGEAPPRPSSRRNSLFFCTRTRSWQLREKPAPALIAEPSAPPPISVPAAPIAPTGPLTILELTATSCRWPIDPVGEEGWRFCGRPRDPKSKLSCYCPEHRERSIGRVYRKGTA
jgi:hypothetical protein